MVEEIQEIDLALTVRGPDRRKAPRGGSDRRRACARDRHDRAPRPGGPGPAPRRDLRPGVRRGEQRRKAIVVRRNGEPFAFAVDRMLGQQEVVVRPLEDRLVRVEGISGTTDLGDGRPTLVLDLAALGRQAHDRLGRGGVVSDLHVLCKIADAEYVLPAADVLQMESFSGATQGAGRAAQVAGLVQIRGHVVPVLDLRVVFGLQTIEATIDSRVS